MSFILSLCEIQDGEKVGGIYVKGDDYHKKGRNLLIFKGVIGNITNEEFFNRVSQKGIDTVKEIKGEFFILFYDDNTKKIYIANDRIGRETLFYFYDKRNLIISDDFWEIINLIEPDASDIDVQSVKESVIFSYPLYYKTIIKNLNLFPPATIGEFSLTNRTFEEKQYWDFRLQTDTTLSIEDGVERLDRALDSAVKQIKDENDPSATYGIGLSGGLDTRVIAYYAMKHSMDLKSFIIGEKSPHKLVVSRDHKSARELAKYFDLDLSEVEYDSESFENKSFYDMRYAPTRVSNFFKGVRKDIPEFDILLTGSLGILIGDLIPSDIMQLNKEGLLDALMVNSSFINAPQSAIMLKKGLKLIFGRNDESMDKIQRQRIEGIISEKEFTEGVNKIRQFIEDNADKSNIDIFLKYFILHLGAKTKYGAFESLQGWKKAYTIYYPYLMDEILTWKPDFLINRRLLKCMLIKKYPELVKIKSQNAGAAIFFRTKKFFIFRQIFAGIGYVIRGGGVERRAIWVKKRDYKEYSQRILLRPNKLFETMFDVKKIITSDRSGNLHMEVYENLIKIKQILDLIETKGYKKFFKDKSH